MVFGSLAPVSELPIHVRIATLKEPALESALEAAPLPLLREVPRDWTKLVSGTNTDMT